jgi:hypothetical protein
MRSRHGIALVALLLVPLVAAPARAADPSSARVRFTRLAPRVPAGATAIGPVDARQQLGFSVILQPRNIAELDQLLREQHDPASPRFGQWLPTGEFARRFGPSPTTVEQVTDWLHAQGLTDTAVTNMAVTATGPADAVERALGVDFTTYRLAAGTTRYIASAAPLLPRAVADNVSTIVGLSDTVRFEPSIDRTPGRSFGPEPAARAAAAAAGPRAAPVACAKARAFAGNVYWTADQIGRFYHVDDLYAAGLTGLGKTIALLELGRSRPADVSAYLKCFGLTNTVKVKKINGGAMADTNGSLEANIDIQEAATQAPGATIISYEAPNTAQGEYDAYNQIVDDNTAQVVSTSWGKCEALLEAEPNGSVFIDALHTLFKQAAAQGQTVFAASGDTGSVDCYDGTSTPPSDTLQVDNPADDPFVTGVGGTAFERPGLEPVWNDCEGLTGTSCAAGGQKAGGGGQSHHFTRPSWQSVAANATCTTCRQVPDISANAGVGEVFFDSGFGTLPDAWTAVGGTSIAAPMMAGVTADIAQGCRSGRVGHLAPKLNALAKLKVYGTALVDITRGINWTNASVETPGNNDLTRTHSNTWKTTKGFDLASGLGRPIASGIACPQINSLSPSIAKGGSRITLTGVGLERATIKFGGKVAKVLSSGPLKAVVVAPELAGTVTVTASNPIGTGGRKAVFSYPGNDSGRYRTAAADGRVYSFGGAPRYGAPSPSMVRAPIVGMAVDRATGGYWLAAADGRVYNFHAPFYGAANRHPLNEPIVGIAATKNGGGYWLVARDGGIFAFGNARFYGSTGDIHLNQPIVGISLSPRTGGYWLVARDGGIFAFNAPFHGSTGGRHLNQPIVGIAANGATGGYWLVASDGGIFAFNAPFYGSTGNIRLNQPITGMAPTDDARGYRFVAADGGVFNFGDAKFGGSTGSSPGARVVGIAPAH